MTDLEKMGIGYSIASGRLFCKIEDLQPAIEELLGRKVYNFELANNYMWAQVQRAFERKIREELNG